MFTAGPPDKALTNLETHPDAVDKADDFVSLTVGCSIDNRNSISLSRHTLYADECSYTLKNTTDFF